MATETHNTSDNESCQCASPDCEGTAPEGKYFCGRDHTSDAEYSTHYCKWCKAIAARKGNKYVCPVHGPMKRENITTEK